MVNVWEDLGFTSNPYDQRALAITPKDRKLLINRTSELQALSTIANSGKGIIIVEGGVGVGKTSLVNAMQHDLLHQKKNKILPSFQKIELTKDNIEPKNFILSAFSNMIFSLEKLTGTYTVKRGGILKEGKLLVAQTVQSGLEGNFQAFGFGAGISRSLSTVSPPSVVTLPTILNTMDKWSNYVLRNTEYDGPAVIPVNNMDVLDDQAIVEFLNSMRDIMVDRPNILWVLIGKKGLFSLLESKARRVSEMITGQPVVLEPLSLPNVYSAIKTRIELLSMNKKGTKDGIVSDEIVKILYETSQGEIRYIFKRITDIILKFRGQYPSVSQIPFEVAKSTLIEFAKSHISVLNLSPKELEVLKHIVKTGSIRTKDYSSIKLQTPQALSKYLTEFHRQNLVAKEYGEGTAVYYRPTADAIFALKE
jgi:type II secretory pathway predicted ATPase ExeA